MVSLVVATCTPRFVLRIHEKTTWVAQVYRCFRPKGQPMWKYVYDSQKHHNFVCYRPPTILHPSATPSLLPAKWIGHANLLWELHKQEVAKFNDSKRAGEKQHARSLARLKKELEEERERIYAAVSDERDASVAQLREAQEVGVGLDSSSRFCETLHDFHACLLLMCL